MQAQSLQLVKLALLLMVIIHSHQQQQMSGPPEVWIQWVQKGPQIYTVNVHPGNFEGRVSLRFRVSRLR